MTQYDEIGSPVSSMADKRDEKERTASLAPPEAVGYRRSAAAAVAWKLARKSVTLFRRDESDATQRRASTDFPLAKAGDSDG
jgi:hypothetical protein